LFACNQRLSGLIAVISYFRRAALQFLVGNKALSGGLRAKLLGWRHFDGCPARNQVRVAAEDREGRTKLAGYMLRAQKGSSLDIMVFIFPP
jgi:hypothetical protein